VAIAELDEGGLELAARERELGGQKLVEHARTAPSGARRSQ
jgi:hypothetical protein